MRISAVYEDAQKIAEAAVAHPYGVIESNDNNPTMQSNSNLSFTYNNPIHSISSAEGYEEDVMGATMDAYLNGFEDPRRAVFLRCLLMAIIEGCVMDIRMEIFLKVTRDCLNLIYNKEHLTSG